jgi:Plavaka transposase
MLVLIILGSDKTTASVMTGNNQFYPLYLSIGSIHNNIRRAHHGGIALVAILTIPKSMYFCSIKVRM